MRFDRSFQTEARAKPAPPEVGIASDALARRLGLMWFDRSLQTEPRAKPAPPEVGIASDASGVA